MQSTAQNNSHNLSSLILTVRKLTEVIGEETDLLKKNRPQEANKFLAIKNKLMTSYNQEMDALKNRGGLGAVGNGEHIRKLKHETRLFKKALDMHLKLVKALKTVSENMIRAVGDEVAKRRDQTSGYGANAKITRKNNFSAPTSLALNKTI